jgi:hypothetical protein
MARMGRAGGVIDTGEDGDGFVRAGHYGVFSGRTWQNQIYPMVKNVILRSGSAPAHLPKIGLPIVSGKISER